MTKYIILGVIGLIILIIIWTFVKMNVQLATHKMIIRWDEKHAKEKERAEEKKKNKLAEKYSRIYLGNPYLEMILKAYNIIIWGALGAGKTLFANLLCHYLCWKYEKEDRKNRRYNHFMDPEYEEDLKKLQEKNLLRIYANIPLKDKDNNQSQELWPYLTQEKRFVEKGIIFTDEFGTTLGKDLWFSQDKNTIEVERIVEMSRFARQNRDIKWIGTEQGRDNIFKPIRDRGFSEVQALKTYVGLSKWGKFKRGTAYIWRMLMPGYLNVNCRRIFQKQLFLKDKIFLGFKLLMPMFLFMPREYYIHKTVCNTQIKKKHTKYSVLIDYYGHEMMFKFDNNDIFAYNTRQNKANYLKQFDKEGNRIYA